MIFGLLLVPNVSAFSFSIHIGDSIPIELLQPINTNFEFNYTEGDMMIEKSIESVSIEAGQMKDDAMNIESMNGIDLRYALLTVLNLSKIDSGHCNYSINYKQNNTNTPNLQEIDMLDWSDSDFKKTQILERNYASLFGEVNEFQPNDVWADDFVQPLMITLLYTVSKDFFNILEAEGTEVITSSNNTVISATHCNGNVTHFANFQGNCITLDQHGELVIAQFNFDVNINGKVIMTIGHAMTLDATLSYNIELKVNNIMTNYSYSEMGIKREFMYDSTGQALIPLTGCVLPSSNSTVEWLTNNWYWLALGGGAVVLLTVFLLPLKSCPTNPNALACKMFIKKEKKL